MYLVLVVTRGGLRLVLLSGDVASGMACIAWVQQAWTVSNSPDGDCSKGGHRRTILLRSSGGAERTHMKFCAAGSELTRRRGAQCSYIHLYARPGRRPWHKKWRRKYVYNTWTSIHGRRTVIGPSVALSPHA